MPATTPGALPCDEDALYAALLARDPAYDGFWYVGVTSTGVFCRLTCPARKPRRANVRFYRDTRSAEAAGFRACLRCRPLDPAPPASALAAELRALVEASPDRRWTADDLRAMGHDPSTVQRAFRRAYGTTFAAFARSRRLGHALARLREGAPVIEAQLDAAYESGSGFREAVARLVGTAPRSARAAPGLRAAWMETPIGAMLAVADEGGIHLLEFADRTALPRELEALRRLAGPVVFGETALHAALQDRLRRYFADPAAGFDFPVAQRGTPFETAVWAALARIPPGSTTSYGGLAAALGRPGAARAVARANGANRVAILVPCHRVVGADGALRGYGGKPWRKRWLLEHERRRLAPTETDHAAD